MANVRAFGYLKKNGVPVIGTGYLYRVAVLLTPAWHAVVTKDGVIGPEMFGSILRHEGQTVGFVNASASFGAGFYDVPGGLDPNLTYAIQVHSGSSKDWIYPVKFDGTQKDLTIGGSTVPGPGPITPAPDLDKQFTKGTFTSSFSYYGGVGAPFDRVKRDFDRFSAAGFGNARVWVDWEKQINGKPIPGCRVFDRKGNIIQDAADRLTALLDYAASVGITLDLTMHAGAYDCLKVSGEGYKIEEHKLAVKNLVTKWGNHPGFRILDLGNEAEARGPSPGSGSPANNHVSPARLKELMDVARPIPHTCLLGISVSAGGDKSDVVENYRILFRDTKTDILLPHFPRIAGWGAKEGPNAQKLMAAFPGIVVHHQEPARNNYNGQNWPVAEFEAGFKSSKAAGSVGFCFHTGAGFDLTTKDCWDQLDPVERQIVAAANSWV